MVIKRCGRCQKEFPRESYLRQHLARKTPCALIVEPEELPPEVQADPELEKKRCHFCGRVFSSNNTKNRHIRTVCKIAPNKRNGNAGMDYLYAHVVRQDAERAAQEARHAAQNTERAAQEARHAAEMAELRNEVNELRAAVAAPAMAADRGGVVIAPARDAFVNIDRRNFTINVFGAETTSHITREQVRGLFDYCVDNCKTPRLAAHAAVEGLVAFIYCDPQHPENFTCYQPNQKEPVALVHTAKGWKSRPVAEVLSPMTIKAADSLFAKQPCMGYQKYDAMVTCIIDNELEFERGADAKNALANLKEYLNTVLTELPIEGGVLQLAEDAVEPPPLPKAAR